MKHLKILVITLGLMFASASQAQFFEALIAGIIGTGVNTALANSQRDEIGTVGIKFNVYFDDGRGNLIFVNTWDPSTSTSTYWTDSIVLQVVPFTSGPPAADNKYYLNDRLVYFLDIDAGRYDFRKKKIVGAVGAVGDYPFIPIRDVRMGINQVKVRAGRGEWGSVTFTRLNLNQFLHLAQSEEVRMAISGAGHSTYPVLQSYTARMPNGQLRNFASVEQMQMELTAMEQQGYQRQDPPIQQDQGQTNSGWGGQGYQVEQRPPDIPVERKLFTIHTYRYNDEDRKVGDEKAVMAHLAKQASLTRPLESDTIGLPTNGDGVAVLVFSREKMVVEYVSGAGKRFVYTNGSAPMPDGGTIYSALVNLKLGPNDDPNGKLLITVGGQTKEIKFRKVR